MQNRILGIIAVLCACALPAQSLAQAPPLSGKLSLQWDQLAANPNSPLIMANLWQAGTVPVTNSGATLEAELRSSGSAWNAVATLQQQSGRSPHQRAWLNELALTHDAGDWQFSAGKKIVAWDVGYAFRPNDVVQQEKRRTLVSHTAQGRPVLMAEHFDAGSAWSLVWVNPTKPRQQSGAEEPALAARVYLHQGGMDWHGFARAGAHTGASVGAALAWVASDALELHASARYLARVDSLAIDPSANGLMRSNPWQASRLRHTMQALVGGTWTTESQFSILFEAWWDGTALPVSAWRDWQSRKLLLTSLTTRGAPPEIVAANLAWQAGALGASPSLQRANMYLRLSWTLEGWQPSLDLLYQPADRGRMVTAALLWKGDRVQLQGGLRAMGGPSAAVLMQLPQRAQAFAAASWAF